MKSHKLLATCLCSVLLLLSAGCLNNQSQSNEKQPNEKTIYVKQSDPQQKEKKSSQQIAKHLVSLATSIPNVNDATAVVIGPYAVVGIDVNSKIDQSKVGTIKFSVAESLKKDPYGKNAVVIADPDTVVRLKEMGREIREGQPVAGVLEELAAIVGRVMPEIPKEIQDSDKKPTDENQDQLKESEEQKLEKEQEDQSKAN